MADIKFDCPHCQQHIEAPEEVLGVTVNCPTCQGAITVPKPGVVQSPPPVPPKHTKVCPFCGEEILAVAVKCKHCGEFLDGRGQQKRPAAQRKSGARVENELWRGKPSFLYYLLWFILGVILIPFGLGWLLIVYALLDRATRVYTLTSRRVTSRVGIISRTVHEVAITDIRNLNVKQGIVERLFGLGTVQIGSAGTAGIEVEFRGVSEPMRVRDLIRREKDEADSTDE
jgi:membrane protein YdbS with pleckstrin-like domain